MRVPDFAALHDDGKLRVVERDASTLLRLSRWPATELYFGRNKVSRFDDPLQQYGVAYVARSLEVAFAETVLHESALYEAGVWIVPGSMLRERSIVHLEANRTLRLVDLTGPSLKRLGLDNQVSAGTEYGFTWALSRALHESVSECDGILYVSRHNNTGEAVGLFERSGARIDPSRTQSLESHSALPHLLALLGVELLPDADRLPSPDAALP
jgi:hypothetical protein